MTGGKQKAKERAGKEGRGRNEEKAEGVGSRKGKKKKNKDAIDGAMNEMSFQGAIKIT